MNQLAMPITRRRAPVQPLLLLGGLAVAHVVLAMVMRAAPIVGVLHGLACLAVGMVIAARGRMQNIPLITAYIVGSEVLWRMTGGAVAWEFGKYAVCLIVAIGLLRARIKRNRVLVIAYLVMLLPSIALTFLALDIEPARQQVSFNLSGPLCLTLCVLLFSNLRLSKVDLERTFAALILPVISICALAFYSTSTAIDLRFIGDSMQVTSGGFGPNQVSAMLGLALLLALLLLFDRGARLPLKIGLIVLSIVLAAQAALTFSRGGLTMAFAAAFCAMFYLVRDGRTRATLVVLATLLTLVGRYAVVPQLETFTAGKLGERYTDLDPSGRGQIIQFDLEIFADNPLLGVGPGIAPGIREQLGHAGAAHTEFTRMLAEHGILGAISIVLLLVLGVRTFRDARGLNARALVVAMLVWVTLFLSVNAMRLAAPSFLIGLACAVAYSSQPRRAPA